MNIKFNPFSASLVAALLLAGCSMVSETPQPATTAKEAGVLGARICFENLSGIPMTAGPIGKVVSENADHRVGEAGPISSDKSLCFAGWNSTVIPMWTKATIKHDEGIFDQQVDVAAGVNIDGKYNALEFVAHNTGFISGTGIMWTDDETRQGKWALSGLEVGESLTAESGGHLFKISRSDDSEYYKEFTVQFKK